MWENILYFLISLAATTAGAISGIGGGVIIKPVLDAISDLGVATISFLSGCTVLSMSVVSLMRTAGKSDVKVEPRRGTLLALGAAFGGVAGKSLFDLVKNAFSSDSIVGASQSAILVLMTVGVFFFVRYRSKVHPLNVQSGVLCVLIGIVLGLLSAFLGIGGGPINIAVLYYFFAMDAKTSALNSIYIILFSQITSLISTFVTGSVPGFTPMLLLLMIAGGILGGFLGRSISSKLSNQGVDNLFSVVLVVIVLISAYNFVGFVV